MGEQEITNASTGVTPEQMGGSGPSTDLSTQNMPAGTTRVENGQAFDASGKPLGSANTAPPAKPKFNPGAPIDSPAPAAAAAPQGAKPKFNPNAPIDSNPNIQIPSSTLNPEDAPDHPSNTRKFWNYINTGYLTPDAILHAMTGHTKEELEESLGNTVGNLASGYNPNIVTIPGFGSWDVGVLDKGLAEDASSTLSTFTSPLSLATFAAGAFGKGGNAIISLVRAGKTAQAADAAAVTASTVRTAKGLEVLDSVGLLKKSEVALQEAIAARDAGTGTQEAVVAARNSLQETSQAASKAKAAYAEAQETHDLARAAADKAARNLEVAHKAANTLSAKAVAQIPKGAEIGQAVAVPSKLAGLGFHGLALEGALTPQQEGESNIDYGQRVAENLGYALMGAGEVADTAGETGRYIKENAGAAGQAIKDNAHVPEAVKDMASRWTSAVADKIAPTIGRAMTVHDAVMNAIGSAGKKAPQIRESLQTIEQPLQAIFNQNPGLEEPKDVASAIRSFNQSQENTLLAEAGQTRDSKDPVLPNAEERLRAAVDKVFADNAGRFKDADVDEAKQEIMDRFLRQDADGTNRVPNLFETENFRRGLNDLTKPQYAANAKPVTDATKFAAAAAANEVRGILDDAYTSRGIDDTREVRNQSARLIDVADALDNAQERAIKAGKGTIWHSLVKKFGSASTVIAIALGHPLGAGAIAASVIGDQIYQNKTNPTVNIKRAGEIAAQNPGATAKTLDVAPPNHAEEGTDLHAELAAHYGNSIDPTSKLYKSFNDLKSELESDIEINQRNNVKDPDLARLQKQMNKSTAQRKTEAAAEAKKAADKTQQKAEAEQEEKDKVLQERTEKETKDQQKTIEDVQKEIEQHLKDKEDKKRANLEGNPQEEKPKPAGRESLIGTLTRIVHGPGEAFADQRMQRTPAASLYGHSDESASGHEWAHVAQYAMEGLKAGDISSHLHPDSQHEDGPASYGGVYRASTPFIENPGDTHTNAEIWDNTKSHIRGLMAGGVANELLHGIPIEHNLGLTSDMDTAKRWLEAHGVEGDDADVIIQDAINQVREGFQKHPQVLDAIRDNSRVRERGLSSTLHASEERVQNFQNHVKEIVNANETGAANGENGGGNEGERNGKPEKGVRENGEEGSGKGSKEVERAELQGGHAGGAVASEEELARPGRFVKVSRSGQVTDQGKVPDFNIRPGEAGYQVSAKGPELKAGQETPATKRGIENYHKEVFGKRANIGPAEAVRGHVNTPVTPESWSKMADEAAKPEAEPEELRGRTTFAANQKGGELTPERERLQDQIVLKNNGAKPPQEHPTAIIVGGPGGAGKTNLVNFTQLPDAVHINADHLRAELPEYKGLQETDPLRAGVRTQDEARQMAAKAVDLASSNRQNLIWDNTSSNPSAVREMMQHLKDQGYRVEMHFVDAPIEHTLNSTAGRAENENRWVPPYVTDLAHEGAAKSYLRNKDLADAAHLWTRNENFDFKKVHDKLPNGKEIIHDNEEFKKYAQKAGISGRDAARQNAEGNANAGVSPETPAAVPQKRAELRALPEKTTGDEKTDAAIRAGGGVPAGSFGPLAMFHHESGSTLAMKPENITPESVREHLGKKTEEYTQGDLRNAANDYNKANGRPELNTAPVAEDPRASEIADAYKAAKNEPNNPAVKKSYDALKHDIDEQYDMLKKAGIHMETAAENPYGLSEHVPAHEELHRDVLRNKHLAVWEGGAPRQTTRYPRLTRRPG
jgi:Zeta toxin